MRKLATAAAPAARYLRLLEVIERRGPVRMGVLFEEHRDCFPDLVRGIRDARTWFSTAFTHGWVSRTEGPSQMAEYEVTDQWRKWKKAQQCAGGAA